MNKQRRAVLAFIAVVAVVFFGVPVAKEGTSGECNALAARIVVASSPGTQMDKEGELMSMFAGAMATGMVSLQYPNIPPDVSCTALYWRTLLDPGFAQQLGQ